MLWTGTSAAPARPCADGGGDPLSFSATARVPVCLCLGRAWAGGVRGGGSFLAMDFDDVMTKTPTVLGGVAAVGVGPKKAGSLCAK